MGCNQSAVADEDGLPNQPLRKEKGSFDMEFPTTRKGLTKKRREFWETEPAYGGDPAIWAILQSVAEAKSIKEARNILVENNITSPRGTFDELYDAKGNRYKVPRYCYDLPANLLPDDPDESSSASVARVDNSNSSASGST